MAEDRATDGPVVALVVAVAKNGVIGNNGDMPWRMSSDLRYFKALTMGKPVVMGRKTFESIGRPLPGRPNIVISRRPDYAPGGVDVAGTFSDGLARACHLARKSDTDEVMVIGGGQIYARAMEQAQRIYLTEILLEVDGDTRFGPIESSEWEEISREHHAAGEHDSADYAFVVFERRVPG